MSSTASLPAKAPEFVSDDPWFDVPTTTHPIDGVDVVFPIKYDNSSSIIAVFNISAQAARAELEGTGMRPALVAAGRTLAVIAHFDYQTTGIGPYYEVGLAIPVVPEDAPRKFRLFSAFTSVDNPQRDFGYYVLHLPVSTQLANRTGQQMWQLPKFLGDMDVKHEGGKVAARVSDPETGAEIYGLGGATIPVGLPIPNISLLLFSWLKDTLLRYPMNTRGPMKARLAPAASVRVGNTGHAMEGTLRRLGLDGARPLALVTCDKKFASKLHLGTPVKTR